MREEFVLAVRMEHHHDVGVALQRIQVARLLRPAVADVVRMPDDADGQLLRKLACVVARAVVDEKDLVHPFGGDPFIGALERARPH